VRTKIEGEARFRAEGGGGSVHVVALCALTFLVAGCRGESTRRFGMARLVERGLARSAAVTVEVTDRLHFWFTMPAASSDRRRLEPTGTNRSSPA